MSEKKIKEEKVVVNNGLVNSVETLKAKIAEVKEAQRIFSTYTQEQVDAIFLATATAATQQRIPLAKMAVEDTGMGVVEDKVIKNHFASEYIYNAYKNTQTVGVIDEDKAFGFKKIIEPIGVLAAVIPTTNPTSTAIFKCLLALKTRNGIIFSPHPGAKRCTIAAVKVCLDAAVAAGAPKGILAWIDEPSIDLSIEVMKDADMVLATGGPGMVKSAYSSGKPAVGVGNGNTPALIDDSADVLMAVSSIIASKTFDNGTICASEQSSVILSSVYDKAIKEFAYRGCYIMNNDEKEKVRKVILNANGGINAKIVGRSPYQIAQLAGFECPKEAKILIGEVTEVDVTLEPFAHEKLSPILAIYKANNFDQALDIVDRLVTDGGIGHTSVIYADPVKATDKIKKFEERIKTCRILINTPSSHGGIGDLYNFRLLPSLTLGCGTWAGNSVSENVGIKDLINVKTVAERRENMLWLRTPEKVYFKKGSTPVALAELKDVYSSKKVFIVTDTFLYKSGATKAVTDQLDDYGITHTTFYDVAPDPTLATANKGVAAMRAFEPDCIIAIGGGSAMDAAKIMWIMYEHPEAEFTDLAMRFMDIRKRVYTFPKMGEKAILICIATTSGTGSEVTPFAIITDEQTQIKYSLADYNILPTIAISDADNMMNQPKGLTAASGIDVLTHAIEAYVSTFATDYTNGFALTAAKLVFEYLPRAYKYGAEDVEAREKMSNASTLAALAFSNAFLGINHSLAHKLGANFHVPHGIANALLMTNVMKYNATEAPKMATFSQYKYPQALKRYAEVAAYVGISGKTDQEKFDGLVAKIEELKATINIPKSIKEFGVDEKEFMAKVDAMAEQAFDDQCTGANPRYPLISELKELYIQSFK
ncbi:acetaldehyde dehydrogenase /alcohol dehydrogenase AdhE [Alkalibaculum bacchi]|uniref:Aldehyde-alcohol dehydrogenase n=1 Tax=Alkalibaculum bacchi TaxID=645887 RepID=A0A366IAX7_9FIRM|nr:bifunctional acetaldehyde-CoA/alcohol dehydrogenase [Alkalibaculum bacchi]RBP65333.1 acetaldehyde dehydrogenase /alcohol dehydrogenase AdhE [Alkalibaculum bacchi]